MVLFNFSHDEYYIKLIDIGSFTYLKDNITHGIKKDNVYP
jgi:hypothetical protein